MAISRNAWKRALPVVVSVASLAWVFTRFDIGTVGDALSWRILQILVPALALYGVVTLVVESASIMQMLSKRTMTNASPNIAVQHL